MRIAFLVDEFPSISETFILDQVCGLIDLGCEIDVYARRLHPQRAAHEDVAAYGLMSRAWELASPLGSSRLRRIARGARDVTFALTRHPVSVLRSLNPIRHGVAALKLKVFYRALPLLSAPRYDAIHCHFGPNGGVAVQLREIGVLDAPIVTQFHGYDASSYVREHGRDVYQTLFRDGELFLCVSDRILQRLLELGCSPARARIHHTGVKLTEIAFVQRRAVLAGQARVLTVGRLVEKKGVEYALRAIARLLPTQPGLRYTIVGDGPERATLSALVSELGLTGHVELTGSQPRDVVKSLMAEADILLAPSVVARDGDEEGIPVVLMEALAAGLPVVSSYHAGIPELVKHEVSGLLAPERDEHALAGLVLRLIEEPDLRRAVAQAGRRIIESEYDVAVLNANLLATYRRLAESTGK